MRARTKTVAALAAIGALGVGTVGLTATSSGQATSASPGASRLDDGKELLPKSNIAEEQAIRAALDGGVGRPERGRPRAPGWQSGLERGRRLRKEVLLVN